MACIGGFFRAQKRRSACLAPSESVAWESLLLSHRSRGIAVRDQSTHHEPSCTPGRLRLRIRNSACRRVASQLTAADPRAAWLHIRGDASTAAPSTWRVACGAYTARRYAGTRAAAVRVHLRHVAMHASQVAPHICMLRRSHLRMHASQVAPAFAGRTRVPRLFRLFRSVASAVFLVGFHCSVYGCMQRFAAHSDRGCV